MTLNTKLSASFYISQRLFLQRNATYWHKLVSILTNTAVQDEYNYCINSSSLLYQALNNKG